MRYLIRALFLLAALAAGWSGTAAAQTSPFGRGAPTAPVERKAMATSEAPSLLERWYSTLRRWQSELTRSLASTVRDYKEHGALAPVLGLLLISFLYGVAHAVGPGHGKLATAAFFGANRAEAAHGITMSALIGVFQALSAIVFVGAFALLFRLGQTETVRSVLYVETASYALIAGVGLWIAWGGIIGRGCSHDHGPGAHARQHSHTHKHGHARQGPSPAAAMTAAGPSLIAMLPVALASGLRPCTGAILVLLFTLTLGIFEIGVLATFVMSFGTFLVVAVIGMTTIYLRKAASRAGRSRTRLADAAQRSVGLIGGVAVFAFGALFLAATVEQLGFKL
jgi:ABC-type nickel/cobalt efflux system permease component RcnA